MVTYPPGAWKRLGALLRARRVALNPSYRHRTAFCEAVSLTYRVVFDIEQGKRTNFDPDTLALLELGYGLKAGAIARALEAGETVEALEVAEARPTPDRPEIMEVPTDDGLVTIPVDRDLSEEDREELRRWGIQMARYLKERRETDGK